MSGQALRLDPPPAFLSDPVLAALFDALPEARVVGGAVRDTLAGRTVADIDLATPRLPDAVIAALTRAGLRAIPTGIDHGTVTAVSGGRGFEITTLRRDVETDGRHAVVAYTDDWAVDAARRDFTINAMSMDRDGVVHDPFGGVDDLRAHRVRFVGDATTRIAEDYLRILRFFRFHARFGAGAPNPAATAAIAAGVPGLARLSAERVWSELVRILAAPDPTEALRLMHGLGVLAAVIPEGADPEAVASLAAAGAPADPILRVAALLIGDPVGFAARLKLSIEHRDRLIALRGGPVPAPEDDDAALRRMLADCDASILIGRTWLRGAATRAWTELRQRLGRMPVPVFPIEGRDALALGLSPGPRIGRLLRSVRTWWLAGGCIASADACRAELARLIEADPTS